MRVRTYRWKNAAGKMLLGGRISLFMREERARGPGLGEQIESGQARCCFNSSCAVAAYRATGTRCGWCTLTSQST